MEVLLTRNQAGGLVQHELLWMLAQQPGDDARSGQQTGDCCRPAAPAGVGKRKRDEHGKPVLG